jgi:hypothetical protein
MEIARKSEEKQRKVEESFKDCRSFKASYGGFQTCFLCLRRFTNRFGIIQDQNFNKA